MDLLLLALVSVVLLTFLAFLLFQQSQSQKKLLMEMIQDLRLSNQSLLNQVRASDPFSLQSLNAATQLSPTFNDDEYLLRTDGAEVSRLPVGIGDELTHEDYAAFGNQFLVDVDDDRLSR